MYFNPVRLDCVNIEYMLYGFGYVNIYKINFHDLDTLSYVIFLISISVDSATCIGIFSNRSSKSWLRDIGYFWYQFQSTRLRELGDILKNYVHYLDSLDCVLSDIFYLNYIRLSLIRRVWWNWNWKYLISRSQDCQDQIVMILDIFDFNSIGLVCFN